MVYSIYYYKKMCRTYKLIERRALMNHGGDDLVNVPVPRRLYSDVIRFVADKLEAGSEALPVSVPEQPQEENFRGWTRDHIRRLKQETHLPAVVALLDHAIKADGESVGMKVLEQATGKTFGQVRGDLLRLGTFRKKLGIVVNTWPFLTEAGADGKLQYRVPENVRRWWEEA